MNTILQVIVILYFWHQVFVLLFLGVEKYSYKKEFLFDFLFPFGGFFRILPKVIIGMINRLKNLK